MSDVSLTLLVARDEDGEPVVCGAWETNLLDIIGADDEERLFARARDQWLPDYVDWRPVTVLVSREGMLRAFESPVLEARFDA